MLRFNDDAAARLRKSDCAPQRERITRAEFVRRLCAKHGIPLFVPERDTRQEKK